MAVMTFTIILCGFVLAACGATTEASRCGFEQEITVIGSSMEPLISDGEKVVAQFGEIACTGAGRGDTILYHWAAEDEPLIKTIRAIPGDTLSLTLHEGKTAIFVNGEPVKNSIGDIYYLSPYQQRVLALYVNDYGEELPDQTYLILGDNVQNGADSRKFGLVSPKDIIGLVEME